MYSTTLLHTGNRDWPKLIYRRKILLDSTAKRTTHNIICKSGHIFSSPEIKRQYCTWCKEEQEWFTSRIMVILEKQPSCTASRAAILAGLFLFGLQFLFLPRFMTRVRQSTDWKIPLILRSWVLGQGLTEEFLRCLPGRTQISRVGWRSVKPRFSAKENQGLSPKNCCIREGQNLRMNSVTLRVNRVRIRCHSVY